VARSGPASFLPPWLLTLFLLAFSFGTDDLVIAGVLPDLSWDPNVLVAVSGISSTSRRVVKRSLTATSYSVRARFASVG
jgi:predicted MFS family arabinose efflux permease